MTDLRHALRNFNAPAFRERVDAMFNHVVDGPFAGSFELPVIRELWQPFRVRYEVIAFAAQTLDLASGRLLQEISKLRASIPTDQTAWLFWRREPRCLPVFDNHSTLEGKTWEEIDEIEPDWIEVNVRIAVPQADWQGIEIKRAAEPTMRIMLK